VESDGDLTLHGVTKPVVLEVESSGKPITDPMGNTRAGASATAKSSAVISGWSGTRHSRAAA